MCLSSVIAISQNADAVKYWSKVVEEIKPGDYLEISRVDLMDIVSYSHNGATFTAADQIMGKIPGSAHTHCYRVNEFTGAVTFHRVSKVTDRITYVDPDRRQ